MTERAQGHTLEAVIGSLILLTSLLLALQMTTVTPLSASTSSQFIESQQQSSAEGALAAADEAGWLKKAVLYWDGTNDEFHGDDGETGYTGDEMPNRNRFGQILESTFSSPNVAYNVYFVNKTSTGLERLRYVYSGTPTDKSVSASRTVTIMDYDELVTAEGEPTGTRVDNSPNYFMETDSGGDVYQVVEVRVVAWKN